MNGCAKLDGVERDGVGLDGVEQDPGGSDRAGSDRAGSDGAGSDRAVSTCMKSDAGSGTMLGVVLIMGVAVCLTALTLVGNALVVSAQARSAADMAALAAAGAYQAGEKEPCRAAVDNAAKVDATVLECRIVDEDALVSVLRRLLLTSLPPVEQRSRAGPEFCDELRQ